MLILLFFKFQALKKYKIPFFSLAPDTGKYIQQITHICDEIINKLLPGKTFYPVSLKAPFWVLFYSVFT